MKNKKLKILASSALVLFAANTAFAKSKVSSPYITKNKLGLEYRGGYDFDDSASKDRKQGHKIALNYGITDRLRPEIKLVMENKPDESFKVTGAEVSLRWQFLKPEDALLAAALDVNYKPSVLSDKSDKLELKLLLGKKFEKFLT